MNSFFGKRKNETDRNPASGQARSNADMPDLESLLNADGMVNDLPAAPSATAARPNRSGTFTVRTADGDSVEAAEVLTVLRDVAEGGLLVQIGDKVYRNPPALADSDFKRRFNTIMSELAKSLSTPAARTTSEMRDLTSALPAAPDAPISPPPMMTPPVTSASPPSSSFDLPKYTLPETSIPPRGLGRRPPKPTNEPIPEINVGGSVESFLQHKLSQTPTFAGRRIHILPAVKGGVVIEVDGTFYETVSDIEADDVRTFLQSTIDEWGSRQ